MAVSTEITKNMIWATLETLSILGGTHEDLVLKKSSLFF